jgi:HSP20 family molecular chaperone IbpA
MSVYAPSTRGFQSLLRISRSSIASPPWFASPVEAEEDENSITVTFHVPEKSHDRVRVEASDQSVTVWGRSRAVRLCALPCSIVASGIETARSGDLLRVRIPKKRPATDSTEPAAAST